MKAENIFEKLWQQYVELNPEVQKIHDLFVHENHKVINDHIALRTFDDKRVCKEVLAKSFIDAGYEIKEHYNFEAKKLDAFHLEHTQNPMLPKVFISELRLNSFSKELNDIVSSFLSKLSDEIIASSEFSFSGASWGKISIKEYESLLKESEYAAWVSVFGYMANHFTVKVNELGEGLDTIEKVNEFIEKAGYEINSVGGKVKGTPEVLLIQSSTLANKQVVEFTDGSKELPTCFYEFAQRFNKPDGTEFSGFIADNADKIFSSTDNM